MVGSNETESRLCVKKLSDDFSTYDQNVDIVSCWQSFLDYGYKDELTFFDRYPRMGDNKLTPDFTTILNKNYGIVAEVKRTFPKDDKGLLKEMKQLMKYDSPLPFRVDSEGNEVTPETHDIMLITSMLTSSEVSGRIEDLLKDSKNEVEFERNLVIIEYMYDSADRVSRYIFKKPPHENRPFADTSLPEKKRLETIMGKNRKPVEVQPKHFMEYKIKLVFCNDAPPPLYTVTYLWTNVFYDYLSDEEVEIYRRGNHQKILPIDVKVAELKKRLNEQYIPGGRVRSLWLKDALEFLREAGLAEQKASNVYSVKFRNLRSKIGKRKMAGNGERRREEIKEYGSLFAQWYCDHLASTEESSSKPSHKRKTMTRTLKDFP